MPPRRTSGRARLKALWSASSVEQGSADGDALDIDPVNCLTAMSSGDDLHAVTSVSQPAGVAEHERSGRVVDVAWKRRGDDADAH